MKISHLIDFNDLDMPDWEELLSAAYDILENPAKYADACKGKLMTTLFYEPSTRTQFSFQAAMMRMGGSVIGFSDPASSSVAKGETLKDTVKIVSTYTDIVVIRNPIEGSAKAASLYSRVPVINAGDGGHLHPTQTLTDLLTISKEKGRLTGLSIGVCGDLLNGRTVHSLLKAFTRFKGNRFYLISTSELTLPRYMTEILDDNNIDYTCASSIQECIGKLDVLYMTRIQRERFSSIEEYNRQSGVYVLDAEKLKSAKSDLIIMHPLPKVDEIAYEVDLDSRAVYFKQAEYGMYIRMALIYLLTSQKHAPHPLPQSNCYEACRNPRCITNHEKDLPRLFKDTRHGKVCEYCEVRLGDTR